jgi:hypothetical protein
MALSERLPSLRASLRWSVVPERCLRGSAEINLRSSPFCRPGALSYPTPLSVPHKGGITCLRVCILRPSTILKWRKSLPCFGLQCLLSWSRCLGAHPMTPSTWRLWVIWLPNFRSWRSGARGLSGLPRGSVAGSLGYHPVSLDWLIIRMRPPNSLGWSWLQGGKRMPS